MTTSQCWRVCFASKEMLPNLHIWRTGVVLFCFFKKQMSKFNPVKLNTETQRSAVPAVKEVHAGSTERVVGCCVGQSKTDKGESKQQPHLSFSSNVFAPFIRLTHVMFKPSTARGR